MVEGWLQRFHEHCSVGETAKLLPAVLCTAAAAQLGDVVSMHYEMHQL